MLWFMGFVVLFTLGGVAGLVMAEPTADYQLANSLFLVAHFHTMIVSGVLFGYFAGLTYWVPKIFGFTLDEKLGRRAFWLWLSGFILAFGPLYILGFMGATRRLNHYAAGLGWQPLFIVAGIGATLIALGFITQIAQVVRSIRERKAHRDTTGDPWNGRTLEWSIPSPAPAYNFAVLPEVHSRDAYYEAKQSGQAAPSHAYSDIVMPRNTGAAPVIAAFVFLAGFGIVWHIWWLLALGLAGAIIGIFVRAFAEDTERIIPAAEVAATEARLRAHAL
jgi:cytochrome o ubiquinol oxidase subunit 1